MPMSTLRLTAGFRYWNSLGDFVLFYKPPSTDAFSSDPNVKISATWWDRSQARWCDFSLLAGGHTTLPIKRQVPSCGCRGSKWFWEFNTFKGFFCSWSLLMSSLLGKKYIQSGNCMNIGWGQVLTKIFSPHAHSLTGHAQPQHSNGGAVPY